MCWRSESQGLLKNHGQVFKILYSIYVNDSIQNFSFRFYAFLSHRVICSKGFKFITHPLQTGWIFCTVDNDSLLSNRTSSKSCSKKVKHFIYYQLIIKNVLIFNAKLYKINSSNLALSFTRSSLINIIEN